MTFKSFILSIKDKILPSGFQIRRVLILFFTRMVFLAASFLVYFSFLVYMPEDIGYRYEISLIASITIILLFLLPIVERFTQKLNMMFLSEYLMEDPSVSRIAYKSFNIDSLIKAVFPDMVKIAGSESGRLAVLTENGTFDIYSYRRGRQKKIQTREENTPVHKLIQFLLKKKKGVSIIETVDNPDINQDFVNLRSDFILPFLFREKIFGFLALSSIPDVDSLITLNFLARQCALVIHNHNLSSHIVENMKYRQEEESAKRIQNTIQYSQPPKISGLSIEFVNSVSNVMMEFFKLKDLWHFLFLNAGGNTRSAGLIHSYISGSLYSGITRGKAETFTEIKEILHKSLQKAEYTKKFNYILGKINSDLSLEILMEGSGFRFYSELQPNLNLVSLGWKNTIQNDKYPVVVEFRYSKIMRIYKN